MAGLTEVSRPEVLCRLPHKERLIVGQQYIFEVFGGPGTEPNLCEFTVDPDAVLERDVLEVRLPIKKSQRGEVMVQTEVIAPADRHWSRALPPPLAVPYHIIDDKSGDVVANALIADGREAALPFTNIDRGNTYRLRAADTKSLVGYETTKPFQYGPQAPLLKLPVKRVTAKMDLVAYVANEHEDEHHWSAKLHLPRLFDVVLIHKALSMASEPCVVSEFVMDEQSGSRVRKALDDKQLFVGEKYLIQIGCSVPVQVKHAKAALKELMKHRQILFNGAGEKKLNDIGQAWSVEYSGDEVKRSHNHALLDELARVIASFPGVLIEVRCEAGGAKIAPAKLAELYKLKQEEDVPLLMIHLARNRAESIVAALVTRGVPKERLKACVKRHLLGRPNTEFVPKPREGPFSVGFQPVVREFTVEAESRENLTQSIPIPLVRTSSDLIVKLINARSDRPYSHWSSALPVASGVPIIIRHKMLGIEVLRATVYDGEIILPGSDLFYENEIYSIEVLETIRTQRAIKEIAIHPAVREVDEEGSILSVRPVSRAIIEVERPARRITCTLLSERQTGDRERELKEAKEAVDKFMSKNKVYFNGASEDNTTNSALGTAQAWMIDHLDGKLRMENNRTLEGIAEIMQKNPHVSLEIRGETTASSKALKLGEYFHMDPVNEVREIMDLLARRRAEACYERLLVNGVEAARMWVTSAPMGEAMKVDFIPHASQIPDQFEPLPPGIPYKILHQRHVDHGLATAMRKMSTFMETHRVTFNGAGENLPKIEQAWSIDHIDTGIANSNRETLQGLARILIENDQCALEVHGETGDAQHAPAKLAAYLHMNRTSQVKDIMDRLAEYRAEACLEALVDLGVERERLFVTYSGLGAATAVHFLPRSQRPYAPTTASEYLAEDTFAVVHEGITRASGNEVLCNLPAKAALYVDETYYLQVAPPPLEDQPSLTLDNKRILPVGKAHFRAAYQQFTIKADSDPDIVKDVRLELKRVKRGALKVTARRKEEGQWWDKLHTLPGKIPYAVHKVIRRRKAEGRGHGG